MDHCLAGHITVTEPYESVGLLYHDVHLLFQEMVTEPYESVGLLYQRVD